MSVDIITEVIGAEDLYLDLHSAGKAPTVLQFVRRFSTSLACGVDGHVQQILVTLCLPLASLSRRRQ